MEQIYLITFVVQPSPNTKLFDDFGGAYINAYIYAPSESDALKAAQTEIRKSGWLIGSIEDLSRVCRDDFTPGGAELEYYEQALVDKEVLVIHTWPNDAPDAGVNH